MVIGEMIQLFAIVACMTVPLPPNAAGKILPPDATKPAARPDLPVICRQINEWTTENWPSAQTGVLKPR